MKNHPAAVEPRKGNKNAAGLDLASVEHVIIPPHSNALINTGIAFGDFPNGCYGQLVDKSSNLSKYLISGGVIDRDYIGSVKVNIVNFKNEPITIVVGEEICQIVFVNYMDVDPIEVNHLDPTERGSNGFGSTTPREESFETVIDMDERLYYTQQV